MIGSGLEVITCGANVPFADKEIFFGSIMEHTDYKVSLNSRFYIKLWNGACVRLFYGT